jgi:hypothetical protein
MDNNQPSDRSVESSASQANPAIADFVDLLEGARKSLSDAPEQLSRAAESILGNFSLTGKEPGAGVGKTLFGNRFDKEAAEAGENQKGKRSLQPGEAPASKEGQKDSKDNTQANAKGAGKDGAQDNVWQVEKNGSDKDKLKLKAVQNVSPEQFKADNPDADLNNLDKDKTYNLKTYQSKLDSGWKVEGKNEDGTLKLTKEMALNVNHKADHSGLIETTGNVSAEHVKAVTDKVNQIPENVRQALERAGYKVLIGPSVVEALPELKGQTYRGWTANFDYSDGTQDGEKRLIVAPEKVKNEEGKWEAISRPEVVTHQFGHALDAAGKQLNGKYFSQSKEFQEAYQKDVARLSKQDAESDIGKYLTQPNGGGARETFASIFGLTTTGPENPGDKAPLERMFPNTIAYMEKLKKELK